MYVCVSMCMYLCIYRCHSLLSSAVTVPAESPVSKRLGLNDSSDKVCMYVCICVCAYVCVCIYIYIYIYIYIQMT